MPRASFGAWMAGSVEMGNLPAPAFARTAPVQACFVAEFSG